MKPFTITRGRFDVTATCDTCRDHATRRTDTQLDRWRRAHTCEPKETRDVQ